METYAERIIAKGMEHGIHDLIKMVREFSMSDVNLVVKLIEKFFTDRDEAEKWV